MEYITDLKKVCSKSTVRPELKKLLFTEDSIVATDGYKIIKVKAENTITGLIDPKLLKKGDVLSLQDDGTISVARNEMTINIGKPESAERYPANASKTLIAQHAGEEGVDILLNRKYLLDILNAFPDDKITIRVPKKELCPIVITSPNATGLVMPINR